MNYFFIALLFPLFCCAGEAETTSGSAVQQSTLTPLFTRDTVRADFFNPNSACGLNLPVIIADEEKQRLRGDATAFSTYVVLYMRGIDYIGDRVRKLTALSMTTPAPTPTPGKKAASAQSMRVKKKGKKPELPRSFSEIPGNPDSTSLINMRKSQSNLQLYFEQVGLSAEQIALIPSLKRYREQVSAAPRRLTQSDRRVGVYGREELLRLGVLQDSESGNS